MRWGPGPVFVYECVTGARRWQAYAARSVVLAVLLLALATIALSHSEILQGASASQYARLGEFYFYALIGVELSIVMLAAPAATAGAICSDRARGTLTHILATDLADSEIVLGKLAARLLPVLGLVACTWPVMAISSLLGGIDPVILTMAFAVIVAVAILGCSLALALSVWATKPHEVVAVVYTLWAFIILAYPIMWLLAAMRVSVGLPRWLLLADPFYLTFAPYLSSGSVEPADFVRFIAVTLATSAAFVLVAVWRMRPVSSRGLDHAGKTKRLRAISRLTRWLPGPSLDITPVLWREWHRTRPSGWLVVLGAPLWTVTTAACVFGAYRVWRYGVSPNEPAGIIAGLIGEVLQVVFGLLILSAVAPMALSEERQQSSLDVLVVTPLSTRSIVMGKWLGTFRLVPLFAIGPGLMMVALAAVHDRDLSLGFRLFRIGLMLTTIVAHGAVITTVGLALATWIKRQSRAIAVSVCVFIVVDIAWPIIAMAAAPWRYAQGLAALSPIMTAWLLPDKDMTRGDFLSFHLWVTFWDIMVVYCAFGLLLLTIRSFDGCFGRTPERLRRSPFIADLVTLIAGGIAIASIAGAIVTWANVLEPQSLHPEDLFWLVAAAFMIMTGLSLLAAVATVAAPTDDSNAVNANARACWWRAARLASAVALGPGLIALALATAQAASPLPTLSTVVPAFGPANLSYRLIAVALLVSTILVEGAAISALSLALSVWTKRRDRAIALGGGMFVLAAIAWPLLIWYAERHIQFYGLSMLSFLAVMTSLAAELVTREPQVPGLFTWAIFRIVLLTLVTIALLRRTFHTVDREPRTGTKSAIAKFVRMSRYEEPPLETGSIRPT